ncbi:MAG: helix-turn-helix transcriptional regulator [Rhizobacter sp.]|jgi:molybdate transport repressor ModE-like protein|nr:helix-turn-helix transcriptional regulator [Rhizobacter sp.]MBP6268151.1 helix-turn-helix transcriptional regulator [Rhizobacter sp.]
MLRINITPHWELGVASDALLDTTSLLALLAAVQETGAIAQGARTMGMSYRHAWGQIKKAEELFGHTLLNAGRGRGSTLTPLAEKLIWADRRIAARLSPMLESLASELANELERTLPRPPQALRVHASHGFAIAALMQQLTAAGLQVELRYRNSFESVAALSHGECDLAGFHVPIGEFEVPAAQRYRRWLRDDTHLLVQVAVRTQGLFAAPGNPKFVRSFADLRRKDLRFVNRPEGSGTRMLTELMLAKQGISHDEVTGFDSAEFTHAAVAAFIASDMADVGVGVQTAAQRFGLHFIPLVRERYFLAMNRRARDMDQMPQVIQLLQSPAYRSSVAALGGYEAADTGRVLGVREAFGV